MTITVHFIEASKQSACRNPGLGVAFNGQPLDVLPLEAVQANGKTTEDVKAAYELSLLSDRNKTCLSVAQNARWILGL